MQASKLTQRYGLLACCSGMNFVDLSFSNKLFFLKFDELFLQLVTISYPGTSVFVIQKYWTSSVVHVHVQLHMCTYISTSIGIALLTDVYTHIKVAKILSSEQIGTFPTSTSLMMCELILFASILILTHDSKTIPCWKHFDTAESLLKHAPRVLPPNFVQLTACVEND